MADSTAIGKATSVPLTSKRTLGVDDFQPWRHSLRSMLKRQAGLQLVGEAVDGLAAVQAASALKPDLILLDVGLPNLNGIEAAKRIRQLVCDTKVLFLTLTSKAGIHPTQSQTT